jgi:hypothetical protein
MMREGMLHGISCVPRGSTKQCMNNSREVKRCHDTRGNRHAAGRGADHVDGVCADDGRCFPLPARETSGQLPWADSAGVQFGRASAGASRGTALCGCCWWKQRRERFDAIRDFGMSICIAATARRKEWPRWRRQGNWPFDSTGCCAQILGIQRSFVPRAARRWRWSAQARPRD